MGDTHNSTKTLGITPEVKEKYKSPPLPEGAPITPSASGINIEPEVKYDEIKVEYVRGSEPLLRQTILRKNKALQLPLFNTILASSQNLREKAIESNISVIGLSLSVSERVALHAIQTLFTRTNYEGNTGDGRLRCSITDYLDAYGLKKKLYNRGKMEYHSGERQRALKALDTLNLPFMWYMSQLNKEATKKAGGKKRYDILKGIDPVIGVQKEYHEVTEAEKKAIKEGKESSKLKALIFIPTPIFKAQSFVLIPENLFKKIRLTFPDPPTHFLSFIDLLILEAKYGNYHGLKRYYSTLAEELGLSYITEKRQKERLRSTLEDDFQKAKELGLLLDYATGEDSKGEYVMLELNPEEFYQKKGKALPPA